MSESTSLDKLDQMLAEGAISEEDYHQLWNAMRAEGKREEKSSVALPRERKLSKNFSQGKICGVCAGFGAYFGCDPNLIRIFLLITVPFLGVVSVGFYLSFSLLLPWDAPEEIRVFRKRGHQACFVVGTVVLLVAAPTLLSVFLLPQLANIYEAAGYDIWSSQFQSRLSGRAFDALSEYGFWLGQDMETWWFTLPILTFFAFVFFTVYYNLCNARFRRIFVWTVLVSGAAWLVFMVAGSLYPLFTLVAPV